MPTDRRKAIRLSIVLTTLTLSCAGQAPLISEDEGVNGADLIVFARVGARINPEVDPRFAPFWIRVEQTLAGPDETGNRLAVRPGEELVLVGERYYFSLGWGDLERLSQVAPAAKSPPGSAPGALEPRRFLWVRMWPSGVEFFADPEGRFEWSGEGPPRSGRMPVETLSDLVEMSGRPFVSNNLTTIDGQELVIRIVRDGEPVVRRLRLQDHPLGTEFLAALEKASNEFGEVLE